MRCPALPMPDSPSSLAMSELTAVGIDYTKVTPLQQKRLHSFLTQYVSETVSYLNRLSTACEEQLEASSVELRRLDDTLSILESKLASLPADQTVAAAAAAPAPAAASSAAAPTAISPAGTVAAAAAAAVPPAPAEAEAAAAAPPRPRVADHPLYAGFFRMLKVGVPIPAIKAKMQASGVDPSVLDLDADSPMPDALMSGGPAAAGGPPGGAVARDSDSGSNFTDSD